MPKKITSSSQRVNRRTSHRDPVSGNFRYSSKTLGPLRISEAADKARQDRRAALKAFPAVDQDILDDIVMSGSALGGEETAEAWDDDNELRERVLRGDEEVEISHAGGEIIAFTELHQQLRVISGRSPDYRTRRDRARRRQQDWNIQMQDIVQAYMEWKATEDSVPVIPPPPDTDSESHFVISAVDIFVRCPNTPVSHTRRFYSASLLLHGLIPSSPISPTIAITVRTLEIYRLARLRSPSFSIQAFVKTICDQHGIPYRRYLRTQFSLAFDVYLTILRRIDTQVAESLERDSEDWRLKNACPACLYELEDDPDLPYRVLGCLDGNNSLKRVGRRAKVIPGDDTPPPSIECDEVGAYASDYFLTVEKVDLFANDIKRSRTAHVTRGPPVPFETEAGDPTDGRPTDTDPSPCVDRWRNMMADELKKMWSIFDETGIFISICRHGITLLVVDMVKSGELAKYALAIIEKLLRVLGGRLALAYDIGCAFRDTVARSSLGERAARLGLACPVPAFHGHAHNRLCQLNHHPLYVEHFGMEDFEGCERVFSQSNPVARTTRYATKYHRHQAIDLHFRGWDEDKYTELSHLLLNKYKRALEVIREYPPALQAAMEQLGVEGDETFHVWVEEEKEFLRLAKAEPEKDTMQCEYVTLLDEYTALKSEAERAYDAWQVLTPEDFAGPMTDHTRRLETQRRTKLEQFRTVERALGEMELKLAVGKRWDSQSPEYLAGKKYLAEREFNRALDRLEALIVSRLFELSKMNQSETGYKLRMQIGKALKARSKALRTAVDKYNTAAKALSPPRRVLSFDDVLDFTFHADIDLLRDSRHDVSNKPWVRPAARVAMDKYFKICRAHEEIERLNVEVRRLRTWIRDEAALYQSTLARLKNTNPLLFYQVRKVWRRRRLINAIHERRINEIEQLQGFSGVKGAVGIRKGMRGQVNINVDESSMPAHNLVVDEMLHGDSLCSDSDSSDEDEETRIAIESVITNVPME